MQDIVLIRISGEDRPGLLAGLCEAMAQNDVEILDLGQSVIYDSLNLGMLVRLPPEADRAPVLKDILFKAHELGVSCKLTPISKEHYAHWTETQGRRRHIVTLLGRRIVAAHVQAMAEILARHGLNIEVITRLSDPAALNLDAALPGRACVELKVSGAPEDPSALKREFLAVAGAMGVDIAFQQDNAFRRNRRLVAFDMDSTLVAGELIDELAREAGKADEVAAITAAAMRGELDFKASLRKRLSLLKGLPEACLPEVAARIPLNEGAERLISTLKSLGYTIAIISGGFTYFGNHLKEMLGVDYVFANELEIKDGQLTGEVVGEIVDAERKAFLLKTIAEREKISLQQVVAVGDGANDLPMLNLAGLGIAYHAKPKVKEGARQAISTLGLDSILYLLGLRDQDTLSA